MFLLGGCSRAYFATLNSGDPPQPVRTAIYSKAHSLELDIFQPRSRATPAPVVLFFYGGRWQRGSRRQYAFVGERLAAGGVLALVADYRQYPDVRFPEFMHDAAQAARWTFDHAPELGGDRQRLFIAGHSAGAHLAALLGTDASYLAKVGVDLRAIAGVIGVAGPYDFLPTEDQDLIDIFGLDPAAQAQSQPVNFVDGDEPPFLLLHGEGDLLVAPRNSRRLYGLLHAAGRQATLIRYPGIGHIRIVSAMRFPRLGDTLADMLAFIDKH